MANPSLAMIPSGYKAGKLYSVLPQDGTGDFTVVRNSVATRVNENGVIEEVAANVPRLDYTDGGCPVLLTEPESTNLYLNSQTMVTQDVTTSASVYTVSFYGTGTITLSGSYSGVLVGTGANDLVQLTFTATAGTLTSTVTGDVDEAQIENLSYATSRIRTLGTTVTRLGDVVSGAGDVNTFNSEEGVLYAEMAALADDGTVRNISISDGGFSNRISIFYLNVENRVDAHIRIGGVYQTELFGTVDDMRVLNKFAFSWKLNEFKFFINGVKVGEDLLGSVFSANVLNELALDNGAGSTQLFAKTKAIKVFKTALTDAELIALTT